MHFIPWFLLKYSKGIKRYKQIAIKPSYMCACACETMLFHFISEWQKVDWEGCWIMNSKVERDATGRAEGQRDSGDRNFRDGRE